MFQFHSAPSWMVVKPTRLQRTDEGGIEVNHQVQGGQMACQTTYVAFRVAMVGMGSVI